MAATQSATRIFASPLARRIAKNQGIDISLIKGSGPHGRIVKRDLENLPAQQAVPPIAQLPAAVQHEAPLSQMRKVIAQRLSESKQTIPHFYMGLDCDLDELLELRAKLNARENAGYKLSVNDFVIKATAAATRLHPKVNAYWGGDKLLHLGDIDISVAVAIEGGLITPIVRQADCKSLPQISNEMKELAKRARDGKLAPEEFQGGGFSISNLGMYGIRDFLAVINPPQSCILAVGAGEQRAIVKNGELAVATVMTVNLSVDHRVVDGALAANWLQAFKRQIEDPLGLLL